jgi:hypothetical protein
MKKKISRKGDLFFGVRRCMENAGIRPYIQKNDWNQRGWDII